MGNDGRLLLGEMTPSEWYQVQYTRNGSRWFTLTDDRGLNRKFKSAAAADEAGSAMTKRKLLPAKQYMVVRITESYFSHLEDGQVYVNWDYTIMLV